MSEHEVTDAQEAHDTPPQEGTDQAQEATPLAQDAADDVQQALATKVEKELKEARSEAAKYRKKMREYEAELTKREQADMSESERNELRLKDLEAQLQQRDQQARRLALESAIAQRSNALGIVDAEVAVAMLDTASLEFDDDGRPDPESLDSALKRLIKLKPYLKTQPPAASPANPARTEPAGETDAQRRARLFGGGGGIFDVDTAQRLGGGVLNPDS